MSTLHGDPIPVITAPPMDDDYAPGTDCGGYGCPTAPPGDITASTAVPATFSSVTPACPPHFDYVTTTAVLAGMAVGAALYFTVSRLLRRP